MPNRMSFSFPTPHTENMKKKKTQEKQQKQKKKETIGKIVFRYSMVSQIFKRILGANNKQKAKQQNNTKWIILKS